MPLESVSWALGRKTEFISWIHAELHDAQGAHDLLVKRWVKWLELYRAPADQPVKNFPYENAANFMLPSIATDADQLYAKFLQTIHAADNVWTTTPLNERWVGAAKPAQDFLEWLDQGAVKIYRTNKKVVSEMVKLGTGIYKTGWLDEARRVWTYDPQSKKRVQALRRVSRPFVDHVKLADFVIPPTAYSPDPDEQGGAQWIAERMRPKVQYLRSIATSKPEFFPNIDKGELALVIRFEETNRPEYDQAVQKQDYEKTSNVAAGANTIDFDTDGSPAHHSGGSSTSSRYIHEIELWELHVRFPTGITDSEDDIVIWYHQPTQKIVRAIYQPYSHGKRPYEIVRYFPGDGFYGIGICEQKEMFQKAQSDLFNFTYDNVLLANSRMVVAKAGQHIAPGEPVYPWKVWITDDDPRAAFSVFPMADIYESLPMLSSQVQALGERRTGISDIQLGNIQELPGRTPATTMMSLLQEGNRRPDLTIKDMRYEGLSTVGLRLMQLCQQFMTDDDNEGAKDLLKAAVRAFGEPEGSTFAQLLTDPNESVELGLGVSITATSGSANKEVEKQNYQALLQLASQIGQQVIQLTQVAMQFQGTPIAQVAEQAINSILAVARRLLEQYDIRNIEDILPSSPPQAPAMAPQVPGGAAGAPGTPGSAGPLFGPLGQPPIPAINPSMAALVSGLGGRR